MTVVGSSMTCSEDSGEFSVMGTKGHCWASESQISWGGHLGSKEKLKTTRSQGAVFSRFESVLSGTKIR